MFTPRIYLAGPDVFLKDAKEAGERKKAICTKYGFEGVYPLDNVLCTELHKSKFDTAMAIYHANTNLIRSCNMVVANLTPFRGVSMDVGTAFEIGYARALDLPIFGYSNVCSKLYDRTIDTIDLVVEKDGEFRDINGMEIENFGLTENLMIDGAIFDGLGRIVISGSLFGELYTNLENFEVLIAQLAEMRERS